MKPYNVCHFILCVISITVAFLLFLQLHLSQFHILYHLPVYVTVPVHSSTDKECFHVLAVMNIVVANTRIQIIFSSFLALLNINLEIFGSWGGAGQLSIFYQLCFK